MKDSEVRVDTLLGGGLGSILRSFLGIARQFALMFLPIVCTKAQLSCSVLSTKMHVCIRPFVGCWIPMGALSWLAFWEKRS